MRGYFEPIKVTTDPKGTPARVYWRRRTFVVSRVLDRWRYRGKWWLSPKGETRKYYQLEARVAFAQGQLSRPRTVEVFKQDEEWTLSYVSD